MGQPLPQPCHWPTAVRHWPLFGLFSSSRATAAQGLPTGSGPCRCLQEGPRVMCSLPRASWGSSDPLSDRAGSAQRENPPSVSERFAGYCQFW